MLFLRIITFQVQNIFRHSDFMKNLVLQQKWQPKQGSHNEKAIVKGVGEVSELWKNKRQWNTSVSLLLIHEVEKYKNAMNIVHDVKEVFVHNSRTMQSFEYVTGRIERICTRKYINAITILQLLCKRINYFSLTANSHSVFMYLGFFSK